MSAMDTYLVEFNDGWIFIRRTPISKHKQTILFIHGIGDSSLSFLEAFEEPGFEKFNIVTIDLLGHGCSSDAPNKDYSFESQANIIRRVVDDLHISELFLVGHSLGGDIATYFVANDRSRVKGLVNIEGNLTPPDVVISKQAVKAAETGNFEVWFKEHFMNKMVLNQWGAKWASCQRYYASLWFCRPTAFLLSAREVCARNSALTNRSVSEIGLMFQTINVPKVYCWGGKISEQTEKYLKDNEIQQWSFEDAFHWPMIDKRKEFYQLLRLFCSEVSLCRLV